MTSKYLGAALAATFLLAAAPAAFANPPGPAPVDKRFGASVERKQMNEQEKVRAKQVKQVGNRPFYEPLFHPLYQGQNSPAQRVKRAFD